MSASIQAGLLRSSSDAEYEAADEGTSACVNAAVIHLLLHSCVRSGEAEPGMEGSQEKRTLKEVQMAAVLYGDKLCALWEQVLHEIQHRFCIKALCVLVPQDLQPRR
jgi:hypothetical protein